MDNNQVLDFTGVNHESNKKLLDDLTFNIAMIRPKEGYYIDIPEELPESIAALKQRLELYQNFMDRQKKYPKEEEYKSLAYIISKDASVFIVDIHETGNMCTEEIVKEIEDAIADGEDFVDIAGSKINVNSVWEIEDQTTGERYTINENNNPHTEPISSETIPKMDDSRLRDTMGTLLDWIGSAMDENDDEMECCLSLLENAIDELEQRFLNEQHKKECVDNILTSFIIEHSLFKLFEKYINELKQRQNNPNDYYEINKELYGDLDQFMQEHDCLKEVMSEK